MDDFDDRIGVTPQQVQTQIINEQTAQKKQTQKIIKKKSSLIGIQILKICSLTIVNDLFTITFFLKIAFTLRFELKRVTLTYINI